MRRGGIFILLWVLAGSSSGCALTEPFNAMTHYTKSLLTFRGSDYSNPTEEEDDPWITDIAEEARKGNPRERDPDQWYKTYFMSEKARSIERNLGFD